MKNFKVAWKKRMLCMVVAVLLAVSLAPAAAFAEEGPDVGGEAEGAVAEQSGVALLAEGDTFTGQISVGGNMEDCDFKVLSEEGTTGTVQIGVGGAAAIDDSLSGEVIIPNTVTENGVTYTVTQIGAQAFLECKEITGTNLATNTNITRIDDYAFAACWKLSSTGLGENTSVQSLGHGAFKGCSTITETGLATNTLIDYVPAECFMDCNALLSTGIGTNDKVDTIARSAFFDCANLQDTGLATNSSVTAIGTHAFIGCEGLTTTGLESNRTVEQIGPGAFYDCLNIKKVEFSKAIKEISGEAFRGCEKLETVVFQGDASKITLTNNLFTGCGNIKNLVYRDKKPTEELMFDNSEPTVFYEIDYYDTLEDAQAKTNRKGFATVNAGVDLFKTDASPVLYDGAILRGYDHYESGITPSALSNSGWVVKNHVGVPGMPVITAATGGDAQVSITWNAPADGDPHITGYKIYRDGVPVDTQNDPNLRSYTNSGLVNGQAYRYTISAINEEGEGPQSEAMSAIPLAVYGVAAQNGSVWSRDSKLSGLTFVCAGELAKLKDVLVDGISLAEAHYTLKQGSTVITLKSSYLNTLSRGPHSLKLVYTDGAAEFEFSVSATPKTGDESGIFGFTLMVVGAAACIVLMAAKRRARNAKAN